MNTKTRTCGHPAGCDAPATHQHPRPATEQEAAAHWAGLELNIRSHGNPDFVQDRTADVTVAEHRCDHPDHAHPGHLAALAAATAAQAEADAYTTAMNDLTAAAAPLNAEQLQQIADIVRGSLTTP